MLPVGFVLSIFTVNTVSSAVTTPLLLCAVNLYTYVCVSASLTVIGISTVGLLSLFSVSVCACPSFTVYVTVVSPKFASSLPIVNVTFLFTQLPELYTVSSPVIFAVTFSTGAVVSIFANVIVSSTTTPALVVNVNLYVPFSVTVYPSA